jgi:PadR family transcriptional regulator, regulatory protein AphA
MSSELTGLSYVVMNLIGRDGAAAHDLVQMARREQRLYWAGAESKIYEQPKRLEKLGYLTSQKIPGKTRERTHYQLTDKGVRALQEWLALRSPFPRIQNEAAIRIQASDLVNDPSVILKSLQPLREEIAELVATLEESESGALQSPDRQRQLKLLHSLGRRLLRTHLEWIDEVEQEFGARPSGSRKESAKPVTRQPESQSRDAKLRRSSAKTDAAAA